MPEPVSEPSLSDRFFSFANKVRLLVWIASALIIILGLLATLPALVLGIIIGAGLLASGIALYGYVVHVNNKPLQVLERLTTESVSGEVPLPTRPAAAIAASAALRETGKIQEQSTDLPQFKVFPEINLEPHRIDTTHTVQSGVFIRYDGLVEDATGVEKFLVTTDLRIRIDNQDTFDSRVKAVSAFLRRETSQGEVTQARVTIVVRDEANGYEIDLDAITIPPSKATPFYRFECEVELEKSWGKLLDSDCFIRLVFDVIRQPRYCVDLNVDWETARFFDDCLAGLSIRSLGQCQG